MPSCLVSTHHTLFHFAGEVSPAAQVSKVRLAASGCIHGSLMGRKGDVILIGDREL